MLTRATVALLLLFAAAEAFASAPEIVVGQVYTCPNGRSIKILGCAPDGSVCDVQAFNEQGQPVVRGKNTAAQLQGAITQCPPNKSAPAPSAAAAVAPGSVSATGTLRNSGAAAAAPARPAGGPPKPGLTSCAGKFEGRYASEAGTAGMLSIRFHAGTATVREPDAVMKDGKLAALYSERDAQCWYGGGKIYLRWLNGDTDDFPIDVNDDGTLDTTYGELKKKGG